MFLSQKKQIIETSLPAQGRNTVDQKTEALNLIEHFRYRSHTVFRFTRDSLPYRLGRASRSQVLLPLLLWRLAAGAGVLL